MAIVIDQADLGGAAYNGNTTNTMAFTTANAVASGGFIVIAGGWYADSAGTVSSIANTGSATLSWTVNKQPSGGAGFVNSWIASAQAPAGLSAGAVITATLSASQSARFIMGMSFTGVATSSPVDGTPTGQTSAAGTAAWSTDSYAIAAGSVIVAGCMQEGVSATNATTAPSIEGVEKGDVGDTISYALSYRIEASANSYVIAGAWSTSVSHSSNAAVAYKVAAGGETITLDKWYGKIPDLSRRRIGVVPSGTIGIKA